MISRLARPLVKLALLGIILWIAQRALTRWVNGPKATPSSAPWPPVGGPGDSAGETPRAAPAAAAPRKATATEPPAATPTATEPGHASGETPETKRAKAPSAETTPPAKAAAKRAAKKAVPPAGKTAPGKIVAANKVRGAAKKAGRAAPASPTSAAPAAKTASPADKRTASARIVAAEKRASATPKWLPPDGDACPPTHQVKAKIASMIYHLPGMASYARTAPDRCYASAEDAEADGFARAKR